MASVRTEALMERYAKNSNSSQRNTPNPPGNHLTLTNKYATKEQHSNDDVKNIKHQALLIIIKDLKMASLNELFILLSSSLHLSTGWLSPPLPPVLSPSSFNFEAGYWGAFRDTSEVSRDACQTIHFQPVWSGHRMVLVACYCRWRYPPHFLRREIVDTVLRTNQTLLKTRKHAFFFWKWDGLILISLPLIVV